MKIALVVDNPYRDLPGLVLVALSLCQRGATCFLVPSGPKEREIWTLAPDFVLLNNLRMDKERFVRLMLSAGIRVGVLDTEGGVFRDLEQYAATVARDSDMRSRVSCFCSWGPRLAEHAVKSNWYRESQVSVTGTPRMDFYAEPWREASLRMLAQDVPASQPLVLVNSNFSLANPLLRTGEGAARDKIQRWGFDEGMVMRLLEAERRAMQQFVELTNNLSRTLPGVAFVYRPHPFENPETYRGLLEDRDNLHLVKSGTVDGWILRSRAVIQRGCSTAIEATLAGVPAFSPGWVTAPMDLAVTDAVSLFCSSEEELAGRIRQAVGGGLELPDAARANLRSVLADWFFEIDGNAHQRVAAAILRAYEGGSRPSLDRCRDALDGLANGDPSWPARGRAWIRRSLNLPITWSFRRWKDVKDSRWDRDQRFFGTSSVRNVVDVVQPVARRASERWTEIEVQAASEPGDYHFAYSAGRSTVLRRRQEK